MPSMFCLLLLLFLGGHAALCQQLPNVTRNNSSSLEQQLLSWLVTPAQAAAIGRPAAVGKVRICFSPYTPYVFCDPSKPSDTYSGYLVEMFRALTQHQTSWLSDFDLLYLDCLGWTDMLKDLASDNGTCLMAPAGVSPAETVAYPGIHISWITDKEGLKILTVPDHQDVNLWSPLTVFSIPLWALVLVSGMAIGVIVWVVDTIAKNLLHMTFHRHAAATADAVPAGICHSTAASALAVNPARSCCHHKHHHVGHRARRFIRIFSKGSDGCQQPELVVVERHQLLQLIKGSNSKVTPHDEVTPAAPVGADDACKDIELGEQSHQEQHHCHQAADWSKQPTRHMSVPVPKPASNQTTTPAASNFQASSDQGPKQGGGCCSCRSSSSAGTGMPHCISAALHWLGTKPGDETAAVKRLKKSVGNSMMFMAKAGLPPEVHSVPARIVLFAYGLLLLILLAMYTANSAAQLTVRMASNIQSVQDLKGKPVATWTDYAGRLLQLGVPAVGMKWETDRDEEAMLDMVRGGQTKALVINRAFADYTAAHNCEFAVVGDEFAMTDYGTAYNKRMQPDLMADWDSNIAAFIEQGSTEQLYATNVKNSGGNCQQKYASGLKLTQVSLHQVAALWVMLALSIGISCVMLLVYFIRLKLKKPAAAAVGHISRISSEIGIIRRSASPTGSQLMKAIVMSS